MKRIYTTGLLFFALFARCPPAEGSSSDRSSILIECERFDEKGGWSVDSQFIDEMGSSYLLAHGLGKPVADARTRFTVSDAGEYTVFARTKNWTAYWSRHAAGVFALAVDGKTLSKELGTAGDGAWVWQKAGSLALSAGAHELSLTDLTGFDGRCDAIYLTRGGTPPENPRWTPDAAPDETVEADLVVCGAGIAGICAAISAARLGVKVALVTDRPVLGGANSSEVRVHLGGWLHQGPYPRLGDVVAEIGPAKGGNAGPAERYEDDRKLAAVTAEKNIRLFLDTRIVAVEAEKGTIKAVTGRGVVDGRRVRFTSPLFADCTGDGVVGALAGADFRIGREGRDETGEERAPEKADRMTMGASVQWNTRKETGASFPIRPWMLTFTEKSCCYLKHGDWNWETGMNRDQLRHFEYVRDYGMLAVYSNWAFIKNRGKRKAGWTDLALDWVAHVAGKRETRRLLGDHILTQQDVFENRPMPDGTCWTTWSVDLHYPMPENMKYFPEDPFRSICRHSVHSGYGIPYRCFYSRNVNNLFMAGRNISVTHVALGTVRVMRTTGMMGEVVGMAAAVCTRRGCRPRGVYAEHLGELKALMKKGVGFGRPQPPQKYNRGQLKPRTAVSPDGRNKIAYLDGRITVSRDGRTLFGPQAVALSLDRGVARVELVARNDGVAYRFVTDEDGEITVKDETCTLVCPSAWAEIWVGYNWCDNPKDPKQDKLQHGCASMYTKTMPRDFVPDGRRIAYLPLTLRFRNGTTVLFSESDLRDYAGMHLRRDGRNERRLDGVFGKFPVREKEQATKHHRRVTAREDYIVKTKGRRTFPWRVFAIADRPIDIAAQRIVYDLAAPSTGDFSWVRPGVSAWEWWNDLYLENVPFKPGVNTRTYRHYIDFAAEYGLAWMLVDEGWSVGNALEKTVPGFDLDEIVRYAAARNVQVMLWTSWRHLDGRQEEIFPRFARRGVKGFKIDFLERDDAAMMRFMEETLAVAAKYRLCIDYHGCAKPTGLEKTYPNLVGLEGVRGLELMKMSASKNDDFAAHDCQVVYTRGALGMVDYTPGAMRNLTRAKWRPNRKFPASQGTRVHQMALFTLFPAPFQVMCDSPSLYRKDPACTKFIASVPTVWDETVGLCGEIGRSAALARRKGAEWWVAAITDSSARKMTIDTSFLKDGTWSAEVFADGDDAAEKPQSRKQLSLRVTAGEKIDVDLAPGGGWTARFTRKVPNT